MTFTLSLSEYRSLLSESRSQKSFESQNSFETVFPYPEELGHGIRREIMLRDSIDLCIEEYRPYKDFGIVLPERLNLVEYDFCFRDRGRSPNRRATDKYFLKGSGLDSTQIIREQADKSLLCINVDIPPSILETFLGDSPELDRNRLSHLMQPDEKSCYHRIASTTVAMKTAAHQLLNCPFEGVTKKMYLESKIWELMSLLIDEELRRQDVDRSKNTLTSDVIERIHYARSILLEQLDNPPSLSNLARKVQLNECILKRGFRQVFGETAFSCVHNHRMEWARQLLITGEVNVSEAARKVGIVNRGHFAAAFRKKYGVSPSEYLRQRKNSG